MKFRYFAVLLPLLLGAPALMGVAHQRRVAAAETWAQRQAELLLEDRQQQPPATATEAEHLLLRAFYYSVARRAAMASLFDGPDSLVARAVGSAEGTRRPDGGKNPAYAGHTDPGNQAWNLGTFSYQHGASSPEEADRKQLERLEQQALQLQNMAKSSGLTLTLDEFINGIDLANQAPAAALDRGYIPRLKEAKSQGLTGDAAILYARTQSYRDPDTGAWDAPGLGNNAARIEADQQRRMDRISEALQLGGGPYRAWLEDALGDPTQAIAQLRESGVMAELQAGMTILEDGEIQVSKEAIAAAIWQFGLRDWSSKCGDNCLFRPPPGVSLEAIQNDFAWELANAQGKAKPTATLICPTNAGVHTSGFGWRIHPKLGSRRLHRGTDIGVPVGTPILAAGAGVVEFAGENGGAGLMITLRHADGTQTRYFHNSQLWVQVGQAVDQGTTIALSGNTGISTGPHLHFELITPQGEHVDPLHHVDCSHLPQG